MTCDLVNTFWAAQRGFAVSDADAAACDAVSDFISDNLTVKVFVRAAAAACCGGADDSVCGAPRTTCDSLAACDGENTSESSGDGVPIAAIIGRSGRGRARAAHRYAAGRGCLSPGAATALAKVTGVIVTARVRLRAAAGCETSPP